MAAVLIATAATIGARTNNASLGTFTTNFTGAGSGYGASYSVVQVSPGDYNLDVNFTGTSPNYYFTGANSGFGAALRSMRAASER